MTASELRDALARLMQKHGGDPEVFTRGPSEVDGDPTDRPAATVFFVEKDALGFPTRAIVIE